MKTFEQLYYDTDLAKSLAAEDIRRGDVVAILDTVYELPSFLWNSEPHLLAPQEPVRVRLCGSGVGKPLKVKSICLPYVLVKLPNGRHGTLDTRRHRLVRLSDGYAKMAWKQYRKSRKKKNK